MKETMNTATKKINHIIVPEKIDTFLLLFYDFYLYSIITIILRLVHLVSCIHTHTENHLRTKEADTFLCSTM